MVVTYLELVKVYIRLDSPQTALTLLEEAQLHHMSEPRIILGVARLHEEMNNTSEAASYFRQVLALDASNVEAISCLAASHFYNSEPEVSLRYYRRLLQRGLSSAEIWSNMGLCCYFSSQYDMALSCFERALEKENLADVWYNIGHVALGVGDASLAYQAFKLATSIDLNHAEALNNLAVLEARTQHMEAAQASLLSAQQLAPHLFEPHFNGALFAFKAGNFSDAFSLVQESLRIYPEHSDSKELSSLCTASSLV